MTIEGAALFCQPKRLGGQFTVRADGTCSNAGKCGNNCALLALHRKLYPQNSGDASNTSRERIFPAFNQALQENMVTVNFPVNESASFATTSVYVPDGDGATLSRTP